MYNSIIEKRFVNGEVHNLILEIPINEYRNIYDGFSNEIASEIVNYHLQYRGDDGRPSDIEIRQKDNSIIKICAKVKYLRNDHTEYRKY